MNTIRSNACGTLCRILFFQSLFVFAACSETTVRTESNTVTQSLQDSVIDYNQVIVARELREIEDYILRYHWEMNKTQTGLRYMIYKTGSGTVAREGDFVTIKYQVNLLNGEMVYSTDATTGFTFEAGKRKVVSGLEEGVMLMKQGDRAKLIVPSHLAFGLLGDLEKIPARAVLVYDVEISSINPLKK